MKLPIKKLTIVTGVSAIALSLAFISIPQKTHNTSDVTTPVAQQTASQSLTTTDSSPSDPVAVTPQSTEPSETTVPSSVSQTPASPSTPQDQTAPAASEPTQPVAPTITDTEYNCVVSANGKSMTRYEVDTYSDGSTITTPVANTNGPDMCVGTSN